MLYSQMSEHDLSNFLRSDIHVQPVGSEVQFIKKVDSEVLMNSNVNNLEIQIMQDSQVAQKNEIVLLKQIEEVEKDKMILSPLAYSTREDASVLGEIPAVSSIELEHPEEVLNFEKKPTLWLGSGLSYLSYQQKVPVFNSDMQFESFNFSSLYFEADYPASEKLMLQASLKQSTIKAESSPVATVENENLDWYNFALNSRYSPQNWKSSLLGQQVQAYWHAGLQYHSVPILVRKSINTFEGDKSRITMVTGGLGLEMNSQQRIRYDAFLRYQFPVAVDGAFSIEPNFDFDGLISVVYLINSRWDAGLFWYGQWHDYDFTYLDSFLGTDITGNQVLFYSSFEFRIGYAY